jgi:hypothetical protein
MVPLNPLMVALAKQPEATARNSSIRKMPAAERRLRSVTLDIA